MEGPEMDDLRVVKFHIPLGLHLRLHQHRLLTHQSISDTVEEALDKYLEKGLDQI